MLGTVHKHEDRKCVQNTKVQEYQDIDVIVEIFIERPKQSNETYHHDYSYLLDGIVLINAIFKAERDKDNQPKEDKQGSKESISWPIEALKCVEKRVYGN